MAVASDGDSPARDRYTGDIEQPPSKSDIESSLTEETRDRYAEKALTGEERQEALNEHAHHLVRDTESQVTLHPDVGDGMEADVTVTVPDTYCFTCEGWVGLSGLDLTGTPRSRAEAYYLYGPPEPVNDLRHRVHNSVTGMVETVIDKHPEIDDPEDAAEFITTETEKIKGKLTVTNRSQEPDSEREKNDGR